MTTRYALSSPSARRAAGSIVTGDGAAACLLSLPLLGVASRPKSLISPRLLWQEGDLHAHIKTAAAEQKSFPEARGRARRHAAATEAPPLIPSPLLAC